MREQGQRAYVGKVSMDRNSPEFYVEETAAGIAAAHAFVKYALQTEQSGKAPTGASTVVNKMKRVASESRFVVPRKESLGALTDLESPETSDPDEEQQARANGSGNGTPKAAAAAAAGGANGNGNGGGSLDSSGHGSSSQRGGSRGGRNGGAGLAPPLSQSPSASSNSLASYGFGTSPRLGSSPGGVGGLMERRMRAMSIGSGAPPTMAQAPPLVTPVVTPRFVPSCTREMLQALGDLSRQQGLPVQSHLSESHGEVTWVRELHPGAFVWLVACLLGWLAGWSAGCGGGMNARAR